MNTHITLKPITLGYDSDVRNPTPKRYKVHKPGSYLVLYAETSNGNVWFTDEDGERGKIECGEVKNLISSNEIRLI